MWDATRRSFFGGGGRFGGNKSFLQPLLFLVRTVPLSLSLSLFSGKRSVRKEREILFIFPPPSFHRSISHISYWQGGGRERFFSLSSFPRQTFFFPPLSFSEWKEIFSYILLDSAGLATLSWHPRPLPVNFVHLIFFLLGYPPPPKKKEKDFCFCFCCIFERNFCAASYLPMPV